MKVRERWKWQRRGSGEKTDGKSGEGRNLFRGEIESGERKRKERGCQRKKEKKERRKMESESERGEEGARRNSQWMVCSYND